MRGSLTIAVSAMAASIACGGAPPAKNAGQAGEEAAPKWESSGASGAAPAKPNAPAPSGEVTIDLDEPISKTATIKDLSATIGGKEVVFRRGRMLGNAREGFALQVYEALSGQPAKAELDLRIGAAPVMGKTLPISVTFLQIADDGPMSLRGVRALECAGKGKLQIAALPVLPKQPPKEETSAGTTSGTLAIAVKCTGDAKEYGAFAVEGRFTAEVLLTPPD